ncbi:MAG: roadblock/LC7 domain-containing protein [Thermodesulfovibrionales bacterium]|nr:roadblock/LC7 domain-containing protein [Thermodesulfovibrionales bacterium]
MSGSDLAMYDNEFHKIDEELQRLYQQANANVVFLVDKNGQFIASAGDTLASLTDGNIAATGGIARLLGEKEFTILFHEGEKEA